MHQQCRCSKEAMGAYDSSWGVYLGGCLGV